MYDAIAAKKLFLIFPPPFLPFKMGEAGGGMSHRRTSPHIFSNSYELRHNQTDAEVKLWQALRTHQLCDIHFRRQHAIGAYVVDFCAPHQKLIIELDGGQHLDQQEYDRERTNFLESKGYRLLRFWNDEVMKNLEGVVRVISEAIGTSDGPPPPPNLPQNPDGF